MSLPAQAALGNILKVAPGKGPSGYGQSAEAHVFRGHAPADGAGTNPRPDSWRAVTSARLETARSRCVCLPRMGAGSSRPCEPHCRAGNNLISSWRRAASCVAFLCPLSGYANKEARGHRGSSPLSGPFFSPHGRTGRRRGAAWLQGPPAHAQARVWLCARQ
jgi:hypothetical protein